MGCTPPQHCREGMLRAQQIGQHKGSTHNCRHVVLCPLSAAGHWEREGAISSAGDPDDFCIPPMPHPCSSCSGKSGGGYPEDTPNPPQFHHVLPASLPVSSLEKHQGYLQQQLKDVGIDHLTPSSFFWLWGHVIRTSSPMSSPSAVCLRPPSHVQK